jgi:ABC-type multidrug transport system permease subunit
MELKMEEVEVKWIHAIQVWWSWLWRTMIIVLPLSLLAGMVAGFIMSALSIDIQENAFFLQMMGGSIGVYFSVSVMKKILSKTFNGYRIALVKVDASADIDA